MYVLSNTCKWDKIWCSKVQNNTLKGEDYQGKTIYGEISGSSPCPKENKGSLGCFSLKKRIIR